MMYKIISIDPGTYHLGVATWHLDSELNILNINTDSIEIGNSGSNPMFIRDIIYRCERITIELYDILEYVNPNIVAIETPFINNKRPTSIIPLAKVFDAITGTVYSFNKYIKIMEISPFEAKRDINSGEFTHRELSDKDNIKLSVEHIEELNRYVDTNKITEHEIDSIAVGYTVVKYLRRHPIVTVTH